MNASLRDLEVLIVDDDAFMIKLTKRILKRLGIEHAQQAKDGAAALQCLDGSTVDVVVCDLNMPGMDGRAFLRHLADREAQPDVPRRLAAILVDGI